MIELMMMFREGGTAMYAVLLFGLPAWFVAFVAVLAIGFKRKRMVLLIVGGLAFLLGLMAIASGVLGYTIGMSNVEMAVASVSTEYRDALLAEGKRVARFPLFWGLLVGGFPALIGIAGLALGFSLNGDPE